MKIVYLFNVVGIFACAGLMQIAVAACSGGEGPAFAGGGGSGGTGSAGETPAGSTVVQCGSEGSVRIDAPGKTMADLASVRAFSRSLGAAGPSAWRGPVQFVVPNDGGSLTVDCPWQHGAGAEVIVSGM